MVEYLCFDDFESVSKLYRNNKDDSLLDVLRWGIGDASWAAMREDFDD